MESGKDHTSTPTLASSEEEKNQGVKRSFDRVDGESAAKAMKAAKTSTENGSGLTDTDRIEKESLDSVGLKVGARIEVCWDIEDENGKCTEKWWGSTVGPAVSGKRASSGRPVFILQYDALDGMEACDHEVSFIDGLRLTDIKEDADMPWKREGCEIDQRALLESIGDESVNIGEFVRAQEEMDAEEGEESVESLGMKELGKLPHHQQASLAAGFRRMADVVKDHLVKLQEQGDGGEVVVSAEDVKRMFEEVRTTGK
ncbi:unnamed protein product [Choristocarpus tenellus]